MPARVDQAEVELTTMAKPPLLTKPLGMFVQLLGLVAILGIPMQQGFPTGSIIVGLIVGFLLLWLGRQTQPRPDNGK
jgi:hypothetical protein